MRGLGRAKRVREIKTKGKGEVAPQVFEEAGDLSRGQDR